MNFGIIAFLLICICKISQATICEDFSCKSGNSHTRKIDTILQPTKRQAARTAILIIAPPKYKNDFVEKRWELGQKVWEQYMNCHPNVDCYFVKCTQPKKDTEKQVWIEENTIYVGDDWHEKEGNDRILNKTIQALKLLLPQYTHFIRTNVNSFFNLNAAQEYIETHCQSMYTTPLWETSWYPFGYCILFTADVAAHIVSEYERLEKNHEYLISHHVGDDTALANLATGICPKNKTNPFHCCPTLILGRRQLMCDRSVDTTRMSRYGVLLSPLSSLEEGISLCQNASHEVIMYRIRDGLILEEIAKLYECLLKKNYPDIRDVDLQSYAHSLLKKINNYSEKYSEF